MPTFVVNCIMSYLYISLGAVLGALSRYQLDRWFSQPVSGFPWTTLAINVTGSFLIGLFANALPARSDLRLLTMVGFCGSYTTFSTYSLEIVKLLQSGNPSVALIYLAASALLAPLACYAGYLLMST